MSAPRRAAIVLVAIWAVWLLLIAIARLGLDRGESVPETLLLSLTLLARIAATAAAVIATVRLAREAPDAWPLTRNAAIALLALAAIELLRIVPRVIPLCLTLLDSIIRADRRVGAFLLLALAASALLDLLLPAALLTLTRRRPTDEHAQHGGKP